MLGGKACGAGGGGCLIFLAEADREHVIREAVQDLGGQILPFNLDYTGLQVWEPKLLHSCSRRAIIRKDNVSWILT